MEVDYESKRLAIEQELLSMDIKFIEWDDIVYSPSEYTHTFSRHAILYRDDNSYDITIVRVLDKDFKDYYVSVNVNIGDVPIDLDLLTKVNVFNGYSTYIILHAIERDDTMLEFCSYTRRRDDFYDIEILITEIMDEARSFIRDNEIG